jgi:GT2 family glycosyltransferase
MRPLLNAEAVELRSQPGLIPPATLIVLCWNSWPVTRQTLDSLRETDLSHAKVIVVDNGSTDETPQALAEYKSWLRVVTLPENRGFVRGCNAGIEGADTDSDIVLLNNDLIFKQADWLQRLRRCAYEHPTTGIVGCRLVRDDGKLIHTGTLILPDTCMGVQSEGGLQDDVGQFNLDRRVQGIVFAVAYLKREIIERIGALDLDYLTYLEDTDYCLRANEAGYDTVLCGSVTITHDQHASTSNDTSLREGLFNDGRRIFSKKWKQKLEGRYDKELVWQSIVGITGGYAATSRAFMRELDKSGVRIAYRYVYGPGTPFPIMEPENTGEYSLNIMRQRQVPSRPLLSVVYAQGDVFYKALGRIQIGFTMLEVDGFPDEWVRSANAMDEVWVPSTFNRDGFLASGLRRPIRVVPLGFDPNYFNPGLHRYPNPHGEFVFLASFEWGERKDPWLLLSTFSRAFSAGEPVRLVAKINNKDPQVDIAAEIRGLRLSDSGGRISYLINREFPYYQLGCLYRSADCFVSAGRGEGWDMPLMEAMACGLPSIATDWGGHREFVHAGIAYPLAIKGTVPAVAKCPYYKGHRWAEPDAEHLAHLLRHVYEHREEAAAIGKAAADEVHRKWTWDHAIGEIRQRLNALS